MEVIPRIRPEILSRTQLLRHARGRWVEGSSGGRDGSEDFTHTCSRLVALAGG